MTRSLIEDYLKKKGQERTKTVKMQRELNKFGTKIPAGRVWTVGDMQSFFARQKKGRK